MVYNIVINIIQGAITMSKSLVAYFSPTGSTKTVAGTLAEAIGADLFEIVPEVPYKPGDLNWMDKKARSTIEMNDPDARPAIAKLPDVSAYDKIYVGFPIWWYVAPRIINTFLEGCELSGKMVIPFATSGSSGMGKTNSVLKPSCGGAKLLEGKVFRCGTSKADLAAWAESL